MDSKNKYWLIYQPINWLIVLAERRHLLSKNNLFPWAGVCLCWKVYIGKTIEEIRSRQNTVFFSHYNETRTCFEGDVTPLLRLKPQQKPLETGRECLSISESLLLLGNCNIHTHTNTCMQTCIRDTGKVSTHRHKYTQSNQHLLLTPSIASKHRHKTNTVPIHLVVWWFTHSHMTMHWFFFSSPPS